MWLRLCVCWAFRHFRFYLKLTRKILLYPLGDSAWLPHFTVTTVALLSLLLVLRVSSLVYRVIHKSLRDFRPLRYSSRDGHAQRGACQHVCGRNLITGLTSAASRKVDISSTCMLGQKFEVSLPLLTCSPSAWPSRLLYRRGRKSRRDLWITLYLLLIMYSSSWLATRFDFQDHLLGTLKFEKSSHFS